MMWLRYIRRFALGAIVGGILVILAAAGTYVIASKVRKPRVSGFTVYQIQRANGHDERRISRSYKANGEWMEVSTDLKTGRQQVMFGTRESGVVRSNNEKMENEFIGGWGMPLTAEQIRRDPQFVDESQILGFRVMRVHMEGIDGSKTDLYKAPDLHGMILRVVTTSSDGGVLSVEPEKIEFNQPEFALPNYPITRDLYNSHHQKK